MDRLNQLRGAAGSSSDSTLDTTSPPSEAFITANESSSKYFSLSEVDSTFDISPIKDVSLASASSDPERTITGADELISNLSPISKKSDILDSYKIGKQIEAANILSGGVDIFDDNDNSYDGDELVIDDNVEIDDKSSPELKQSDSIDFKAEDNLTESTLMDADTDIASKDTEVVLQIDGKNVDAIDIGNGLYLYRKEGQEELAAVQIIDDDQQQPSFKFLKVRENSEGNLEVYEEIEIEVPKEVPAKEGKSLDKTTSHVPIKDINKVINDQSSNKVVDRNNKTPQKETTVPANDEENEVNDMSESKSEVNLNGKMMKFSESRKSPVIGTFTPMTYHSTPNKEGIPLTKTMVDMQLQPSRHSDNVKKTIEVHTDSCKQKYNEASGKFKDFGEDSKETELSATDTEELSTPVKDAENLEAEILENEPKKTDIPEEETSMEDKDVVLTDVAEEPAMPVTSDKTIENVTILEKKISDEESAAPLKINNCGDDASTSNETLEKNNDTKKSLDLASSTVIDQASIQDDNNKPKVLDSAMLQNEPLEKEDIKNSNEPEVKDNLKCTSVAISKTESNITMPKPQEEPVILPEVDKQIPKETHKNKEVIDSSDKNKSKEKIEIIDPKSSKVSEIYSSIVENVPIEVLNNKDKSQPVEEPVKPSDHSQGKPLEDKKDFDIIGEKGADDIIEIEDDSFMETKKESMKKLETELDKDTVKESSPSDTTSGKQETPEIKEQMEIESKIAKTSELEVKQPKSITSKCMQVEQSEVLVEDKPVEKIAESQQQKTDEDKLSIVGSKRSDESTIDTQQSNSVDVTQTCKLDDQKEINKEVVIKKPLTHEMPKVQDRNPSKIIPKPDITLKGPTLDKTEGIGKAPAASDCKLSIANNSNETALNTKNSKPATAANVSTTKTKITQNETTNSEEVKKQLVDTKKEVSKVTTNVDPKPINNNTAVPFGKWTEANRQEFLNKIKESRVPVNSSNSKPIKNSNDLNRRDVLKKIDSQRQSSNAASKALEANKMNIKNETVFTNKPVTIVKTTMAQNVNQGSKIPVKGEATESKSKPVEKPPVKKVSKQEVPSHVSIVPTITTSIDSSISKKETLQRKGVNAQDLIDKTVEELMNKGCISQFHSNEGKSNSTKDRNKQKTVDTYTSQPAAVQPTSLDAIEMKMNELHGIPFIERPPHELPRPQNFNSYNKGDKEKPPENKPTKIPNLLPYSNKNATKLIKENVADFDSEEEIIEHEPVTGDIEIVKKALPSNLPLKEKLVPVDSPKPSAEASKKETIITENDFDKFARRNSVTYENCITVSYDGKEQHNVIQTVVEKDVVKNYSKNDASAETKPKSVHKPQNVRQTTQSIKVLPATKAAAGNEDPSNKNYQSKLQIAYQSALTAKRHMESPITVLEDKPVKVLFMDANPEFIANKLNVQGQNLSPAKKPELDLETVATNDSLDSEITDTVDDNKIHDEFKPKTKHQRKQVLTPVEEPELELIEPSDLGIEVSPKKKRKTEDIRTDKNSKNVIHKKSYLLGRSVPLEDKTVKPIEMPINPIKETIHRHDDVSNKDTVTALDNLVKAAELVENQSENINKSTETNPDSQPTTPVKRGRGRPRKYPLPEGSVDKAKAPSPQKKPRLIDAKPNKRDTTTEEEESSDDEIVKENWTMGKINENIVCPICNKLFRSENVVFKHVKHCTGPSPNRSDTDKRSVRRVRQSQESDSKSEDMDIDEDIAKDIKKYTPKKRRSKDSSARSDSDKEDNVIVIEDTPVKEKSEKDDDRKHHESRKLSKTNIQNRIINNLVCEFCGKTFRQLSYLVSHKLQHKKEEAKKSEKDVQISKSVFSCDICKKEFRKLHHLVQHRLIHNPQSVSSRVSRKSSSDQEEVKSEKEDTSKQSDDPSAGFRCEPCDKSFRKLHHLVEHRETHDGINRQKGTSTVQAVVEKPTPPPQCEICKKTFRKLHHLMEHKEQHLETSSEKSDDKSVKSSLSTKDIIHECPLCYMVFPNEHSLNKHTIICQRKKRQSKQPKPVNEEEGDTIDTDDNAKSDENKSEDNDEPELIAEEVKIINLENDDEKEKPDSLPEKKDDVIEITENLPLAEIKEKVIKHQDSLKDNSGTKITNTKNVITKSEITPEIAEVVMKVEEKEIEKAPDVPKKKTPMKGKVASSMSKRQKLSVPETADTNKVSSVETSDDDEVRYMLNPDFKVDETSEGKIFMNVRAKKRNSLQIERPNSKDLIKRRTSLQHPPKIPRLKPKLNEPKAPASKNVAKAPKLEPVPSTDSDDSDVKYSFPKTTPERTTLRSSKEIERKPQRKSLIEKRKTLSCIAKRKSSGKTTAVRHKETTSPPKQIKRRTLEVEHRCDCGQLFSSAALLARHTSLAHTPPRIRRRRSPPPDTNATTTSKAKPALATRKSSVKHVKSSPDTRKSIKPTEKLESKKPNVTTVKGKRSVSTRTTTVPDKTKKSTQKSKI